MQRAFTDANAPLYPRTTTEVNLAGIQQGQRYVLTATGIDQDAVLEFKQDADTTYRQDPRVSGVQTNGVIMMDFVAISPVMRFRLLGTSTNDWWFTVIAVVNPDT